MTLTFQDTKFRVEFNRIIMAAKNPEKILLNAGREVGVRLRRHFRMKNRTEPNRLSERRTHFWLQVAQSVNQPVMENPTTVSVTISDPRFAQKLLGGTIRAKNAGALTIPVEERAYGRSARTFEAETGLKLFLVRTGKSDFQNAVLAVHEHGQAGFTVEYILTKSVTQKADTDALPEKTALEAAVLARSQKVLDRQVAGQNPDITPTES